ncbi:MAG TPA: sigma-54 dependent transcriptional regulator [Vicinamibacteria bacterium]|nr:sigma-54 dependent transcriptional regulator [Vicinamibacteria bacterium]
MESASVASIPSEADSERASLVVVIDDDRNLCDLVERYLDRAGHHVRVFHDGESFLTELEAMLPDAVCLDLGMPGIGGVETLEIIKRRHQKLPVIILTADDSIGSVVGAIKLGAYDYLVKPIDRTKLVTTVANALERHRMSLRLRELEREVEGPGYAKIVGDSPVMKELYRQMDRVAASDITILIHGDSGSGKELVAQAIHQTSGRKAGPFVALNCAAIPETLQESEIFGHEKGSFTGAVGRHVGKFEQADGGCLFMDEVAELSLTLQAKLLRAIQEKRFHRVGGSSQVRSDFRLIAATHRNLLDEVKAGRFREDLYFRIAVFELEVPSLRARGEDVVRLAELFLDRYKQKREPRPRLSHEVIRLLKSYSWPGNVRELENLMQRCLLIAKDRLIRPEDLPLRLRTSHIGLPPPAEQEPAASPPPSSAPERSRRLETLDLTELERLAIEQAMEEANGNLSQVVRLLGIGRTTLYRKLKAHNLRS